MRKTVPVQRPPQGLPQQVLLLAGVGCRVLFLLSIASLAF
jgi:hypothetical protein